MLPCCDKIVWFWSMRVAYGSMWSVTYRSMWSVTYGCMWSVTYGCMWSVTYRSMWSVTYGSMWSVTYGCMWSVAYGSMWSNMFVRPSQVAVGHPSVHLSCMVKTYMLEIMRRLSEKFCYIHHAYTIDFCHLVQLSVTLTLLGGRGGGSQGHHKAKPVFINVLHTFQVNGMKFGEVLNHFKLNILILCLRDMGFCVTKKNNCCLMNCEEKKL